jgi:signal transduction histidine kinase
MSRKLERVYRELEAASRHKSAFLANMSHELRTPMNAIIGFNRLVMRRCKDILPVKQYENLGKIGASADHLLMLINTVLDLSKIEAGRMDVRQSRFDLIPLLEDCLHTAEPLLRNRNVVLELDASADIPLLDTDRDKLRQVVINLLSNAVKFTDAGRIVLSARHKAQQITISVADTGIGIPADQLGRVFEEFSQVDDSSTRAHAGTGLGLAISQRLVLLLGGKLEVQSTVGSGSTFSIVLSSHALALEPDQPPKMESATAEVERRVS